MASANAPADSPMVPHSQARARLAALPAAALPAVALPAAALPVMAAPALMAASSVAARLSVMAMSCYPPPQPPAALAHGATTVTRMMIPPIATAMHMQSPI
jgi:hypothetical protein